MTTPKILPGLHRSSSSSDLGLNPKKTEEDNGSTATFGAREPLASPSGFTDTAEPAREGLTTTAPIITTQVSRKLQRRAKENVDIDDIVYSLQKRTVATDTVSGYSERVRFHLLDGFTEGRHQRRINIGESIEDKLALIGKFAISSTGYLISTCFLLTHSGPEAIRLFARCRPADPALIQCARECAEASEEYAQDIAREFAELAELGLHDETTRFEIAKACFLSNPTAVSQYLPNFNLTAPQRLSLLMEAADIIPRETALQLVHLQLPELEKQKVLLVCARKEGSEVASNFEELKIDDEAFTFELIKACIIAGNAYSVVDNFKTYALKSTEYKRSLLMLCAKHEGEFTVEHLDNFGIEDFEFLGEAGLVCARQNGDAAAHFKKLGARDLEYKLRFAKACAEGASKGWRSAGSFGKLAIPPGSVTEKVFQEIVLAYAMRDPSTARYLHHFNISDADVKYLVGLLCARNGMNGGGATSTELENIGTTDMRRLITLLIAYDSHGGFNDKSGENPLWAKADIIAASASAEKRASYTFFEQRYLHEDAKHPLLTPDQGGNLVHEAVCKCMPALAGDGFMSDLSHEQIAALAQLDAVNFSKFFRVHTDGNVVPQKNLGNAINSLKNIGINITETVLRAALSHVTPDNKEQIPIVAANHAFFRDLFHAMKAGNRKANAGQEKRVAQAKWVRNIMILVDFHQFSAQTLHALLPLLKAMRALKDVNVRDDLTNALLDMTPESVRLWLEIASKAKQHDAIARFCILSFIGTNPCLIKALDVDGTRLRPQLKDFRSSRPFIKALHSLASSGMPQETQSRVLQAILGNDQPKIAAIVAQFRKLDTLLGLEAGKVRKLAAIDNTQGIDAMLQESLNERLACAEDKPIDMVAFGKIFGAYREPDTLLTYAGRISEYPEAMNELREFIEAVFNRRFPAARYGNDTLLAKLPPVQLEKWKTNRSVAVDEVAAPGPVSAKALEPQSASARYFKLAQDEILRDNHLPEARGGLLESYLRDKTLAVQVLQTPEEADSSSTSSSRTSSTSSSSSSNLFPQFERQCIAFLEAPTLSGLKPLQELLTQLAPASEFRQALGVIENDMNQANKSVDLKGTQFVFTDDHEQLLRMGTDMEGSCQRIDGDPKLNRGLIGTVMDGKSRLCLIVGKSGVIKARAILRLMWNEEEEEHCLFMEPIYPPLLNDSVKGRLTEFAKTIATDLDLEMVSIVEGGDALECEDKLRSGPIRVPLYSDGANGIQSAEFRIDASAAGPDKRLAWIHEFD